jgi:hypothetical protein
MILRPSRRPQKLRCLFPSNPAKKQKPVYSYGLTPPCNAPIQQVKEGDTLTRLRTPVILHTDRLPLEHIKDRLPVKGEHHVADGHW